MVRMAHPTDFFATETHGRKKLEIIFPCSSVCFRGDNIFLWGLGYISSVVLATKLPFQGARLTTLRALLEERYRNEPG